MHIYVTVKKLSNNNNYLLLNNPLILYFAVSNNFAIPKGS